MDHHRVTPSTHQKRLVWLLLVALVLLGLTITQRQVLGSLHTHADVGPTHTLTSAAVSSLAHDWKIRWQRQKMLGHGQLVLATPFDAVVWPTVATRGAHVHGHGALERHHHAADDETVVAIDGAAQVAEAGESPTTSASLLLPAVGTPVDAIKLPAVSRNTGAWPVASFATLVSRAIPPPLRPPTA
jgi:hypothetical protein